MNPVDTKKAIDILEELRRGQLGVDAVFVAVKKKDAVFFKEAGSLMQRARLRNAIKKIL